MIIFILTGLALGFYEQHPFAVTDTVRLSIAYSGIALSLLCIAWRYWAKAGQHWAQDLFFAFALITWYAFWRPFHPNDAPMFFFFPLYFVFVTVFTEFVVNTKPGPLDVLTLRQLQKIMANWWLQSWFVMACVLGSVFLMQQYLLYPVLVTLAMVHRILTTHYAR